MPNLPVRDRSDARLLGVCSALARTWAIDPLVVRVTFVVVGLLTNGFVLAVYGMLWAILPERGGVAPLHRMFPSTRAWSWGTLATIALLVTAVAAAVTGTGPGAFVILALAWLIVRFGFAGKAPGGPRTPLPPVAPTTPFERAAQVWQQRLANVDAGRPADWVPEVEEPDPAGRHGAGGPWDSPAPRPTAPAGRRRGLRTWLGILVALGATWAALSAATAFGEPVGTLAWSAATLVVLGLALLVSARSTRSVAGRPFLLLPVTVLVALGTLVALVPGQLMSDARRVVGADATSAADVIRLPVGDHTIDLSGRASAGGALRYELPIGDLVVVVPSEGNVEVTGSAGVGDVTMPDGAGDGFKVQREWRRVTDPDAPVLTIEAAVGAGEIEVRS